MQISLPRFRTRYVHLVQRRDRQGEPLVMLRMKSGDRQLVLLDFRRP